MYIYGSQYGWVEEGQSCKQTSTHQLSTAGLVILDVLWLLHRPEGNVVFFKKLKMNENYDYNFQN